MKALEQPGHIERRVTHELLTYYEEGPFYYDRDAQFRTLLNSKVAILVAELEDLLTAAQVRLESKDAAIRKLEKEAAPMYLVLTSAERSQLLETNPTVAERSQLEDWTREDDTH